MSDDSRSSLMSTQQTNGTSTEPVMNGRGGGANSGAGVHQAPSVVSCNRAEKPMSPR